MRVDYAGGSGSSPPINLPIAGDEILATVNPQNSYGLSTAVTYAVTNGSPNATYVSGPSTTIRLNNDDWVSIGGVIIQIKNIISDSGGITFWTNYTGTTGSYTILRELDFYVGQQTTSSGTADVFLADGTGKLYSGPLYSSGYRLFSGGITTARFQTVIDNDSWCVNDINYCIEQASGTLNATTIYAKSRGLLNAPTAVLNGDPVGQIVFAGADGSSSNGFSEGVILSTQVDNTVSAGIVPMKLTVTNKDVTGTSRTPLTISSNGFFTATGRFQVNSLTINPQLGTVTIVNGSAIVTGVGTSFLSVFLPYSAISFSATGSPVYTVLSIQSNTQLTLSANYPGANQSGITYYADYIPYILDNGLGVSNFRIGVGGSVSVGPQLNYNIPQYNATTTSKLIVTNNNAQVPTETIASYQQSNTVPGASIAFLSSLGTLAAPAVVTVGTNILNLEAFGNVSTVGQGTFYPGLTIESNVTTFPPVGSSTTVPCDFSINPTDEAGVPYSAFSVDSNRIITTPGVVVGLSKKIVQANTNLTIDNTYGNNLIVALSTMDITIPYVTMTVTITSVGTLATATVTSGALYLSEDNAVNIINATPAGYNGTYHVTQTSSTTFTYNLSAPLTSPATGTIAAVDVHYFPDGFYFDVLNYADTNESLTFIPGATTYFETPTGFSAAPRATNSLVRVTKLLGHLGNYEWLFSGDLAPVGTDLPVGIASSTLESVYLVTVAAADLAGNAFFGVTIPETTTATYRVTGITTSAVGGLTGGNATSNLNVCSSDGVVIYTTMPGTLISTPANVRWPSGTTWLPSPATPADYFASTNPGTTIGLQIPTGTVPTGGSLQIELRVVRTAI